MPPWPFSSAARSGSPRGPTTPDAIDGSLQGFPFQRNNIIHDSDDDSDLDELHPPAPPFAASDSSGSRKGHSRSLSGNLSSFLGGKRRTHANSSTPDLLDSNGAIYDGPSSPRPKTAKNKQEEDVEENGWCATCASKLKWPAGVTEFRCGTCLMINSLRDSLKMPSGQSGQNGTGPAPSRAGTYPGNAPDRRAPPVSMERTLAIISRCIDDFLVNMQHPVDRPAPSQDPAPTARPPKRPPESMNRNTPHQLPLQPRPSVAPHPQMNGAHRDAADHHVPRTGRLQNAQARLFHRSPDVRSPDGAPSTVASSQLPRLPTRQPPPPPMQSFSSLQRPIARKPLPRSPGSPTKKVPELDRPVQSNENGERGDRPSKATKHIFKPLEDYISVTFGRHESLNRSFSSLRPRPRPAPRSEDNLRRTQSAARTASPVAFEGYDTQIDAKTLLLGDVAENGLWWTREQRRADSPLDRLQLSLEDDQFSDLVNPKTPHVNWIAVNDWYRLVIRCGETWRERLEKIAPDKILDQAILLTRANEIEEALLEARLHVQRALLKSSEALLKRPGRPLKSASEVRFLLVLLANPLLYPSTSSAMLSQIATELDKVDEQASQGKVPSSTEGNTRASQKRSATGYWERGYAFGIIKRTLGILSNLSNDCHRALTSWLVRYNEDRFRSLVDLIQSFVTHRLNRSSARIQKATQSGNALVPNLSGTRADSSAQLHAALGLSGPAKNKAKDHISEPPAYSDDWQIKSAARVLALMFTANKTFRGERTVSCNEPESNPASISRGNIKHHAQLLSTSDFYNLRADLCNLVSDFETWQLSKTKFSFCQYPFFFSVGSKIRILEHDAQRQMSVKAREAFFNSILQNKDLQQYLHLRVRRECLVEDSLDAVSQTVAQGQGEIKKGLRVHFIGEEGIDAGGLRKEWFLLLVREIFDPDHGMFTYDDESHLCYFNSNTLEASEQYFLVGALLGLAIYNLTILDIALPPFLFKKLLASGSTSNLPHAFSRTSMKYGLEELSEYRPMLARGLRQLLEFEGDVQETYCRDFVVEVDRYGSTEQIPLCPNGANRPVTNSNRHEFVELYIRHLLDIQVTRQFEPFKRGFFTVCGGNALSLFQPEEIELLIRGSDERLDVPSLKAVAVYENWKRGPHNVKEPASEVDVIRWFWEYLESADLKSQRKVLSFITGTDRIPAMGATSLVIKIVFAGNDFNRFPIARTCFNLLLLYKYRTKQEMVYKLTRAMHESEGFGLK